VEATADLPTMHCSPYRPIIVSIMLPAQRLETLLIRSSKVKKKSKVVPLHAMEALGGRGIAPTHSWLRHYMGVSGQRQTPAALYPLGKDHRYASDRRLGGPQTQRL
jgi:hypothetical protein